MLDELFAKISSEVLTEDTKLQMATLFESALNEAIKAKEVELEESNKAEILEFKESLRNQIDEYLNYFVEEFVKENEDVVDSNVKVKTAERVLEAFQKIVTDFNVELSEESISEDEQIEELKAENTKLVNKLIESKKEVDMVKKAALIAEKCGELETELEKDKLVTLAETVDFDDVFESKLSVFVEQIKTEGKSEVVVEKLTEEIKEIPEEKQATKVDQYLKYF